MPTEWPICLTLTREKTVGKHTVTVKTTDKWALNYASCKLDVPIDNLILERDGTIIKIRPMGDDEEIEFPTFDEWLYDEWGFPTRDDPNYKLYKEAGYGNWLIATYPEYWAATGVMYADMLLEQAQNYHMHRLNMVLDSGDCTEDEWWDALEDYLMGQPFIQLNDKTGVLLWEEDRGLFCLTFEPDLTFHIAKPDTEAKVLGETFDGFE